MNKFFLKYYKFFLVLLILLTAVFVRFYNFENRINFGPEQGISLSVSGSYIKDKFSLLGQEYMRATSEGHVLFTSALFDYSLVPLQLLFNFDPVPITGFFALLNIFTGLVILWIVKKMINLTAGIFSLIIFLFNSYMIYHSLFIWIVNYLPLIGILSFYLLYLLTRNRNSSDRKKIWWTVSLGILSGIALGLEYAYGVTFALIFIYLLVISRNKVRDLLILVLSVIIGTFPLFVFDLKHNFYNLISLGQFLSENKGGVGFPYYHYLHLWSIFALILGLIVYWIYRRSKFLAVMLIFIYLFVNLTSQRISFSKALGMNEAFTIKNWDRAAAVIALDKPQNFNVAALLDFDSRANPLRYFLKFRYDKRPFDFEHYKEAEALYVLASSNYDFDKAIAWEIDVYRPFKVITLGKIDSNYAVFKLTR